MRIITWNANREMRWDLLWNDTAVKSMSWDFIMLQETGEPQTNTWKLERRSEGTKRDDIHESEESFLYWVYSFRPPNYGQDVYITFVRWPGRQKNHVIIITRLQPSAVVNAGNDATIRPVAALLAEIETNKAKRTVLVGCIHVVASARAEDELQDLTEQLLSHCQVAIAQKWVLAGDFNCAPEDAVNKMTAGFKLPNGGDPVSYAPTWFTHLPSRTIKDYVIASDESVFGTSKQFTKGDFATKSDHVMVVCDLKKAKLISLPFRKEDPANNNRPQRTKKTPRRDDMDVSGSDSIGPSVDESQSEYVDNPQSDEMDDA